MIKDLALEQVVGDHHALGTSITLQIFGTQNRDLLQKSFDLIDHYEDIFTVNRDESEVMDINHAAGEHPVQVSSAVYGLVKLAVEKSRENFGFNALIGPVVKLWHIGFKGAHVPKDEEIKDRMLLTDPFKVVLNDSDQSVFLKMKGMELDLGGIASYFVVYVVLSMFNALQNPWFMQQTIDSSFLRFIIYNTPGLSNGVFNNIFNIGKTVG